MSLTNDSGKDSGLMRTAAALALLLAGKKFMDIAAVAADDKYHCAQCAGNRQGVGPEMDHDCG
jgi:hypothetical protein